MDPFETFWVLFELSGSLKTLANLWGIFRTFGDLYEHNGTIVNLMFLWSFYGPFGKLLDLVETFKVSSIL